MMKFIVRFGIIPFGLASIFGAFITIGTILYEVNNYDKYTNNEGYVKLAVKIDSLNFSSIDGNSASIYGYTVINSKMIEIIFGNENEIYFEKSKMTNPNLAMGEYNDTKFHYIWYRTGYKKAYPALPNETKFPVWLRIDKELRLTYIWLFCLTMTTILYKIGINMGFMNKEKNGK